MNRATHSHNSAVAAVWLSKRAIGVRASSLSGLVTLVVSLTFSAADRSEKGKEFQLFFLTSLGSSCTEAMSVHTWEPSLGSVDVENMDMMINGSAWVPVGRGMRIVCPSPCAQRSKECSRTSSSSAVTCTRHDERMWIQCEIRIKRNFPFQINYICFDYKWIIFSYRVRCVRLISANRIIWISRKKKTRTMFIHERHEIEPRLTQEHWKIFSRKKKRFLQCILQMRETYI